MFCPVKYVLKPLQRKATTRAISIGSAILFAGITFSIACNCSTVFVALVNSVKVNPGLTAFTMILCEAHSTARVLVKPTNAFFDNVYIERPGRVTTLQMEAIFTIRPYLFSNILGPTIFKILYGTLRLISLIQLRSSREVSVKSLILLTPALLTQISILQILLSFSRKIAVDSGLENPPEDIGRFEFLALNSFR